MTNNDLQQASAWTRNYRTQNPGAVKAHCLSAATLEAILGQPGCVGVRAYYGLDDTGAPKLILVGYDANDNDILDGPSAAARGAEMLGATGGTGVQIDVNPPPCPPCCSTDNALNS
ncbi:hypothetical protein [Hymenobacter metallilatus]|uniref:Uncharacterized protein n=1 Tax=Hymenobacter metallilatus TaxID=2493666 RepID=A0A3R9NIM9_9BACT|nr:hypothetical protein [Hymenobacter metallilatus]RSK36153.1 hypothetical protein EI290_04515 [Hymenobacter metallilatus]